MIRTNRFASFATTALATAGLGAAALVGAGAASAGVTDDLFLRNVDDAGIVYDTSADAISDGRIVCRQLNAGVDPDDILADYRAASSDISVKQAKAFIVAAASAYCPKHL